MNDIDRIDALISYCHDRMDKVLQSVDDLRLQIKTPPGYNDLHARLCDLEQGRTIPPAPPPPSPTPESIAEGAVVELFDNRVQVFGWAWCNITDGGGIERRIDGLRSAIAAALRSYGDSRYAQGRREGGR